MGRLADEAMPLDQRADIALIALELEGQPSDATATILRFLRRVQASARPGIASDQWEGAWLVANGGHIDPETAGRLAALALEPDANLDIRTSAADYSVDKIALMDVLKSSATLIHPEVAIPVLKKVLESEELSWDGRLELLTTLSGCGFKASPEEACRIHAEIAVNLSHAIDATERDLDLGPLSEGLAVISPRLRADDAGLLCESLMRRLARMPAGAKRQGLVKSIAEASSRLDSHKSKEIRARAAKVLAERLTAATEVDDRFRLSRALEYAGRFMDPDEAATLFAGATTPLSDALDHAKDDDARRELLTALAHVNLWLGPGPAIVLVRKVVAQAARDPEKFALHAQNNLDWALQAMSPMKAAQTARVLIAAAEQEDSAASRWWLGVALAYVLPNMERTDRAAVSAKATPLVLAALTDMKAGGGVGDAEFAISSQLRRGLDSLIDVSRTEDLKAIASCLAGEINAKCLTGDSPGDAASDWWDDGPRLVNVLARINDSEATALRTSMLRQFRSRIEREKDPEKRSNLFVIASPFCDHTTPMEDQEWIDRLLFEEDLFGQRFKATPWGAHGEDVVCRLITVLNRLEADRIAPKLRDAILNSKRGHAARLNLVKGLASIDPKLGPGSAERIFSPLAKSLIASLAREADDYERALLAEALAEVAKHVPPEVADRACGEELSVILRSAGLEAHDVPEILRLIPFVEPGAAHGFALEFISQLADSRKFPNDYTFGPFGVKAKDVFAALLEERSSTEAARRAGLWAEAWIANDPIAMDLIEAEPYPCRLATQELVELLKMPTCLDANRRAVLDHLGRRYGRRFANHWDFVRFAEERGGLRLDFTTPPKRPERRRRWGVQDRTLRFGGRFR